MCVVNQPLSCLGLCQSRPVQNVIIASDICDITGDQPYRRQTVVLEHSAENALAQVIFPIFLVWAMNKAADKSR